MIRCLLFPGYERTFAQGLGILNALWKLEVKQLGTFGLARVRINEVRISEALLYLQKSTICRKMIDCSLRSQPASIILCSLIRHSYEGIQEIFSTWTTNLHNVNCIFDYNSFYYVL